jgi:protease PrsW
MCYLLYIFFGALPSIIWLLFYLRKDQHPESNSMVLMIFFYGMLIAAPAVMIEMGILPEIEKLNLPPFIISVLTAFIGVALIEELLKYLVVKDKVLKNYEFDEPVDAILYMIISALGFAASENMLILFSKGPELALTQTISIAIFRFWGATLLHALCSAVIGYFLAISFFENKNRLKLIFLGLGISTLLHGIYNFSIIEMSGAYKFFIPLFVIVGLLIFVLRKFKQIKNLKSVCKIWLPPAEPVNH